MVDPVAFLRDFPDRIYHVHVKDAARTLDGKRGILGSHLNFGDPRRGWDFRSPGRGQVDFEEIARALNPIGYDGPLSVEWEDPGMDREYGAQDALAYVRRTDFPPPSSPSTRRCSGARTDDGRGDRLRHHGRAAAADDIPEIGVGMLGYAFMGKAHSNALQDASVHLLAAAAHAAARGDRRARRGGGHRGRARATASSATTPTGARWSRTRTIQPLRQRRPERPPRRAEHRRGRGRQARRLREAARPRRGRGRGDLAARSAERASKHLCAFNYRFVPAVRLARRLIESGELGEIHHFRARYLQEWVATRDGGVAVREGARRLGRPRRPRHARRRPGALPRGRDRLPSPPRRPSFQPGREVDDAFEAAVRVRERRDRNDRGLALRPGRKNAFSWEINGSKGSLAFDLERLNKLRISAGNDGFRTRLVSEAEDPFWGWWWPHGHMIGWEHTFVHELHHLLEAIAGRTAIAPYGATFEDGYRASEVCEAIVASAETGRRQSVRYRSLED